MNLGKRSIPQVLWSLTTHCKFPVVTVMILKNYPCNQPYLSGVHMLGPGHTLPHVTLPPIKWWVFRLCLAHRDIVQQAAPDSI